MTEEGISEPWDATAMRRWRLARRLTRRQAAVVLGIMPRTFEMIETGERGISRQIRLLARYYDRFGPIDPLPPVPHQALRYLREAINDLPDPARDVEAL